MFLRNLIWIIIAFSSLNCYSAEDDVRLSVPFAPTPVSIFGNKKALVYELNIQNNSNKTIKPLAIDVNDSPKHTLVEYTDLELSRDIVYPDDNNDILPGKNATLFVWLALPNTQTVPTELIHRMAYLIKNASATYTPFEAPIHIQPANHLILTPPLKGGPWLATGISNYTAHRRSIITYENLGPFIAERYAIDWTKLDGTGANASDYHGEGHKNTDYYAYGQDVLASSNGIVVAMRNSLPDNPRPPQSPDVDILDRPGNYIVIKTNDNQYLVYCHLQPTVLVTEGQKVVQGQPIGYVGSSGDAGTPHLHFDVVNSNNPISPFLAEGIPYTYRDFTLLAFSEGNSDYYLNPYRPDLTLFGHIANQLPLDGMIVKFN